jgi:mRNA-degrading endonuclease RelE of RelBE toxin-antitoxin system
MLTVIETPVFMRYALNVWNDEERETFVNWIAAFPHAGDVIPGTSGLRKVRWARTGMGKRGGSRVIYVTRNDKGEIVLLLVYAKAKLDNLSANFLKRLKEACDGS